jgi:hypothetical protein
MLNPEVPIWLETLIARLMAKDPAGRFASATEVANLLEGYLAHLRQPDTVPAPQLPPGKRLKSSGLRFWMLGLVGLTALGAGPWPWLAGADTPKGEQPQVAPAPPRAAVDERVWNLAFSPDSKWLVTAGGGSLAPGQIQIWDMDSGKATVTRHLTQGARSVAWSPDGQVIATGHWNGTIMLRNPFTARVRSTLTGHEKCVNALAFSADSSLLASVSMDGTVRLWDLKTGQQKQMFFGHTSMVFHVAFFHNGRAIVTGSKDRTARVWDLSSGQQRLVLQGHTEPIECVAISPDDKLLATGSWDRTIKLWDAETGQELAVLRHELGHVLSLAFSPDGEVLASSGRKGSIRFWDLASRKPIQTVSKQQEIVRTLAFAPNGKLLASGSDDKTALLWDPVTHRDLATLSAVGAEAFPDEPEEAGPRTIPKAWLRAAMLVGLLLVLPLLVWVWVRPGRRTARQGQ